MGLTMQDDEVRGGRNGGPAGQRAPGWPVYLAATAISVLWAAGPLAFAIGYQSVILPLNRDDFALGMITIMVLGPCAFVWAAAFLLREAQKLALARAQSPAPPVPAQPERAPSRRPPEALSAAPEAAPVAPDPAPAGDGADRGALQEDAWLRALRSTAEPPPPTAETPNAGDPSWLLAELTRMGIQPRRLLPAPQLAKVDRAFDSGDAEAGRDLVNRLAGGAVARMARRLEHDAAFASAARAFMDLEGDSAGADRNPMARPLRRLLEAAAVQSTPGA
jgi:hypothetical protein